MDNHPPLHQDPSETAVPPPLLYPQGTKHTEFKDSAGRDLSAGDYIRVNREGIPKTWRYKIRHLFRTPNGTAWIDCYGPYDKYGNISTNNGMKVPKYRSFRVDEVHAKCREMK